LLQLDSTFSERTYGASSFRDFTEKLELAGLVSLKATGRNIQVELTPEAARHSLDDVNTVPEEVAGEAAKTAIDAVASKRVKKSPSPRKSVTKKSESSRRRSTKLTREA
jgi:hypothetical protein